MAEVSEDEMGSVRSGRDGKVKERERGIRERVEPCLQLTLSNFLKVLISGNLQ